MNIAKVVAQAGPELLKWQIRTIKEQGGDTAFLEEYGPLLINAFSDQLLKNETKQKTGRDAHFIAHLATDLLRGWPGEPTEAAVDLAVKLAKRLVDQAEKAASAP